MASIVSVLMSAVDRTEASSGLIAKLVKFIGGFCATDLEIPTDLEIRLGKILGVVHEVCCFTKVDQNHAGVHQPHSHYLHNNITCISSMQTVMHTLLHNT